LVSSLVSHLRVYLLQQVQENTAKCDAR